MYHEEQWIDGKLYWREAPDADWKPYSYEAMYQKYVQANMWANELYERQTRNKQKAQLTCLKCKGIIDPTDDIVCGICYNTNAC